MDENQGENTALEPEESIERKLREAEIPGCEVEFDPDEAVFSRNGGPPTGDHDDEIWHGAEKSCFFLKCNLLTVAGCLSPGTSEAISEPADSGVALCKKLPVTLDTRRFHF
jgi:hypothetical protein